MRVIRVVLVAAAVSLTAMACSSDSKTATTSSSSSSSSAAPEDVRAPAAAVAAGLQSIKTIAGSIAAAAGSDKAGAKAEVDKIEPVWQEIEGTVKANDPDAYITFEDSFAVLGTAADDGDAAKAQQGADSVAKAVDAYLAKYPG
jgi:hypothetical protein